MLVACDRPVSLLYLSVLYVVHSHTFRNSGWMIKKRYNKKEKCRRQQNRRLVQHQIPRDKCTEAYTVKLTHSEPYSSCRSLKPQPVADCFLSWDYNADSCCFDDTHGEIGKSSASFTALSQSVSRCNNGHSSICYIYQWISITKIQMTLGVVVRRREVGFLPPKTKSFSCLAAALAVVKCCLKVQNNVTPIQTPQGVSPPEAAMVVSELKCPGSVSLLQSAEGELQWSCWNEKRQSSLSPCTVRRGCWSIMSNAVQCDHWTCPGKSYSSVSFHAG